MGAPASRPIRSVATDATSVILVCRKCSKKLDGGFGPKGGWRLAKALRRLVAASRPRASRTSGKKAYRAATLVREVDCLDLCPKNAVVALRADRPGDWLVVPRGAPVAELVGRLIPSIGPRRQGA